MKEVEGRGAGAQAKRAILTNDLAGLRAFYDEHFPPLYAFCHRRLGRDHHATEEVVQETLLRAIESIADYDPERGDLHTWLALLSRNVVRSALTQRRRFATIGEVPQRIEAELREGRAPDDDRALVGVALARLPERYRFVLEKKYVQGESVRAIAAATATTETTVESLLARARRAFRAAFFAVTRAD